MRFDQMHTNSPGGEVTGSSLLSPYNTQEKTPTPAGQFQCWFSRQRGQRKKKNAERRTRLWEHLDRIFPNTPF